MMRWRAIANVAGIACIAIGCAGIAEYILAKEYVFAAASWGWLAVRITILGVGLWFIFRGRHGLDS